MSGVVGDKLGNLHRHLETLTAVPLEQGVDGVALVPRNLREASEAQRIRAGLDAEDSARVRIALTHFRRMDAPSPRTSTIQVGAAATVHEVEGFLKGWSLTLGDLTPGARRLTVGQWLAGRHAGRRVIPVSRLETAALSVTAALAGGGTWEGTRAPRSAAGPELAAALVGAGEEAGIIVEAVLRALPRYELRERVFARLPNAGAVVDVLRNAIRSEVPLAEAHLESRGPAIQVTFALAGPAFRIRRDRAVLEELVRARGELRAVRRVGERRVLPEETEVGWEALEKALAGHLSAAVWRMARESVVLATSDPIAHGVSLAEAPDPLPLGFTDCLLASAGATESR